MCVRERERGRERARERKRETKSRFNPIQKCQLSLSYDEDTSGEELSCRLSGLPLISFGFIVDDEKLVIYSHIFCVPWEEECGGR